MNETEDTVARYVKAWLAPSDMRQRLLRLREEKEHHTVIDWREEHSRQAPIPSVSVSMPRQAHASRMVRKVDLIAAKSCASGGGQ